MAATRSSAGEDHPRHPERRRGALKNLDEAGIVYIGAEVAGRHPGGQDHAEGRKPDDAGRKLLRAIFGEKASDVRDTSLRLPPGALRHHRRGRVFNRHGVDKDERAWRSSAKSRRRRDQDRDDEGDPRAQHGRVCARADPGQDGRR